MKSFGIFLCLTICSIGCVSAFTVPQPAISSTAASSERKSNLYMAPKDPSRSGTKTDRMEKLAEMERMGSTGGDNGVFIQAAGAFAAFIVLAIAAAASSGLLTQY